ncbi:hypothetical protein AVEN_224889-1 [Araneus ventricosus]|uniref:Uncharacterized protein n=1 Tax=Araneus ventricosus TaxID=182803 RepID=A0A4Y2PRD7_ARAVE|nr:hypothetical protein AVEN_224889-1 [Araneus ventricosus]
MIDFTPAARDFFVRMARPDVFGEEESFFTIRTMPAVIVVFEGESEFPLSLIEEFGRFRILRSLYFSALRNQRVKTVPRKWRGSTPRQYNFQPIRLGGSFTEAPCKPHNRSFRSPRVIALLLIPLSKRDPRLAFE